MSIFLLFFSFVLNIISLLAIVILYTRQNRFLLVEKKQERMTKEIEEIISTYLIEMKEENEEFIKKFDQDFKSRPAENNNSDQIETSRSSDTPKDSESQEFNQSISTMNHKRLNASKAYKKTIIDESDSKETINEKDPFLQQVLSLQNQGMTIEEIAEYLGKGKTEIQLLLKFRQKM